MITLIMAAIPPPSNPQSGAPAPTVPPLVVEETAQPVGTPLPPPIVNTSAPAGPSNTSPGQVAPPPPPKKGLPKIFLFVGIALIIAVLGFLFYRFVLPMINPKPKEVTLTWWGLWEDEANVKPLIDEYQQTHPNVTINYTNQSPQDYRERLTNALAQGRGPDIFRFHNTWLPMFGSELSTVPTNVMTAGEFSQTYYPTAVSDLTSGSGFVGLPLEYDGLGLFINNEIFQSSGKTVPTTWDELRQTAIELTVKDDQGIIQQAGVALGRTENVDHWQEILGLMMLQNGVRMSNPTGKLAEDALDFFTVFSTVDGVWDETLPTSTAAFAGGKLAMYFGPSWRVFEIKAQNPNLDFKVVPVPQLPKESLNEANIGYATYWVEGVWAKSTNTAAAWDFLKFLSSKESLQKLYANATRTRQFGEPYPRQDMQSLLAADPLAGAFVSQAGEAQSWYLASRTFDGQTGINSQIGAYFEDAINAVNEGTSSKKALETAAAGVGQILAQYGLTSTTTQTGQ